MLSSTNHTCLLSNSCQPLIQLQPYLSNFRHSTVPATQRCYQTLEQTSQLQVNSSYTFSIITFTTCSLPKSFLKLQIGRKCIHLVTFQSHSPLVADSTLIMYTSIPTYQVQFFHGKLPKLLRFFQNTTHNQSHSLWLSNTHRS